MEEGDGIKKYKSIVTNQINHGDAKYSIGNTVNTSIIL